MGNSIKKAKTSIQNKNAAALLKTLKNRKITLAAFENSDKNMYSMLHYVIWNGGDANLCQVVYNIYHDVNA